MRLCRRGSYQATTQSQNAGDSDSFIFAEKFVRFDFRPLDEPLGCNRRSSALLSLRSSSPPPREATRRVTVNSNSANFFGAEYIQTSHWSSTVEAKRLWPLQDSAARTFELSGGCCGRRADGERHGKTLDGLGCPETPIDHVLQSRTATIVLCMFDYRGHK
jgi:hypothetical protein